ncbi:unnamed protein product [Brassica rapa]|uniref:Uncharacterized protein n=1 Tax=Brassica campestris TaxID=3711 RepID=A0A8D9HE39_BRACM|nr:unnamed protein product [Brassica rapa]
MAGFRSRFLGFGHIHFALGRSYYWFSDVGACEEPLFSVLSPEFSWFLWQHVKSHETASTSLCWSLSYGGRFLTVATRLCPVLQGLGVPFSPGARGNRELSPLIPLLWTIDTTLLPVLLFDLSSSI